MNCKYCGGRMVEEYCSGDSYLNPTAYIAYT